MSLSQTIDKVIQIQRYRLESFRDAECKALTALEFARDQQIQCWRRIQELQHSKESLERIMAK